MATSSGSDHSIEQIVVPETSTLSAESTQTCFRPTVSRLAWQETVPALAPTDKISQELVVPFTNPVPRRAIRVTSAPVQAFLRPRTCQPVNEDIVIQPVLPMTAAAAVPAVVVPSSISRCSSGPICRICHDGAAAEQLLSPCKCCGTVGRVHQSCLEQWLCATGNDSCEICRHKYMLRSLQKRSFREWLQRHPSGVLNMLGRFCDMLIFVLLTLLTVVGTWFCIRAATLCSATSPYSSHCRWETVAFCSLSIFLLLVYVIWCLVTIRYHMRSFKDWQLTHQIVSLIPVNLPKRDSLAQQPVSNAASDGQQPLSGNPSASGKTDNMELLPLQSHRTTEPFWLGNIVTAQQLPYQENLAEGHWMTRKLPARSISDTVIKSCNSVNI